eukprot:scaffold1061_cov213-Prasinococcus_capsulatus_cf.AAC.4
MLVTINIDGGRSNGTRFSNKPWRDSWNNVSAADASALLQHRKPARREEQGSSGVHARRHE